jgi:hypothetical protein
MDDNLIKGNKYTDTRGVLKYNNDFDASQIKRMYIIENANTEIKRGWQGHKIEQRWFSAIVGTFEILLIKVAHWERPNEKSEPEIYELSSETLDFLNIPAGYITCIKAKTTDAKLLVMADYHLGEIKDEYRFDLEQFECTKNKE